MNVFLPQRANDTMNQWHLTLKTHFHLITSITGNPLVRNNTFCASALETAGIRPTTLQQNVILNFATFRFDCSTRTIDTSCIFRVFHFICKFWRLIKICTLVYRTDLAQYISLEDDVFRRNRQQAYD